MSSDKELIEIEIPTEHTNLNNKAPLKDIESLCNEAINYDFAAVVVYPYYVRLAKELLKDTNIEVCTVVGFPSGESIREVKVFEAITAIELGADMIDMVMNISAIKNKDYEYVKDEIEEVMDAIDGKVLKVIIETNLLTDKEIIKVTEICNECFVNYIKTCTGFTGGVDVDSVDIINKHKNDLVEIKASGGIKSKEDMIKGLVAIPLAIFPALGFPPRKVSNVTTASTLKIGTMIPIKSDVGPIFASPQREVATGSPNSTKLLRNIPCTIAPRFALSFSSLGIKSINPRNSPSTPNIQSKISLPLNAAERSVV